MHRLLATVLFVSFLAPGPVWSEGTYQHPDGLFSVTLPGGWKVQEETRAGVKVRGPESVNVLISSEPASKARGFIAQAVEEAKQAGKQVSKRKLESLPLSLESASRHLEPLTFLSGDESTEVFAIWPNDARTVVGFASSDERTTRDEWVDALRIIGSLKVGEGAGGPVRSTQPSEGGLDF